MNVAALNDLCHLCPPWTQAGCAINAVSREVSKLAADARRRRRRKLLALRNEIRRHTFVTLRNTTQSATCWFKIHGVRDETVAACADTIHAKSHFARLLNLPVDATQVVLESLEKDWNKHRFCVYMCPLDEWEAKFDEWNDDEDHRRSICQDCWDDGFMMYGTYDAH